MVKLQSCWSNTHMSVYAPIKAFSVRLNLCLHVQTNVWQRGPSYSFIMSLRERSRGAAQERHEHRLTVDSWQFLCVSKPRPASNSLSIIISVSKPDSGYLEIWVRRFSLPVKSLAVRLWENSPPAAWCVSSRRASACTSALRDELP